MAVLPDADRFDAWAQMMRRHLSGMTCTKADLRAAINATDQFQEDNAVAFNSAIPQPARSAMNATEKTIMFCLVALKRAGFPVGGV